MRRAVERGVDVFDALQAACVNPVEHYGLDVGLLQLGDPADFIEVDSLEGVQRAAHVDQRRSSSPKTARRAFHRVEPPVVNQFRRRRTCSRTSSRAGARPGEAAGDRGLDGQLITKRLEVDATVSTTAAP